jgi:hypothetical protein
MVIYYIFDLESSPASNYWWNAGENENNCGKRCIVDEWMYKVDALARAMYVVRCEIVPFEKRFVLVN